jgi:hypothetical protein
MNDAPNRSLPTDWEPAMPSEAELLAILAESEAEAEAGLFVPGEVVRQQLLDSVVRMEARAGRQTAKTAAVR